ncbi:MAG: hypothetical protein GY705_20795 [Bacteroidetes bacterium]|nr:hypothetical protein [Bacteroidota bacterium]
MILNILHSWYDSIYYYNKNHLLSKVVKSNDFNKVYLYLADFDKIISIRMEDEEFLFEMNLPVGKYDMEARLFDADGRA